MSDEFGTVCIKGLNRNFRVPRNYIFSVNDDEMAKKKNYILDFAKPIHRLLVKPNTIESRIVKSVAFVTSTGIITLAICYTTLEQRYTLTYH